MAALAGYLLASPTGEPILKETLLAKPTVRSEPHLTGGEPFCDLTRWASFAFVSDKPFDEQPTRKLVYRYNVILGISGPRLIVLSERKKISDYLISSVIDRYVFPRLRPVPIHVDRLVAEFREKASEYRITSLLGRYSGPDLNIRTIMLYGTEVTDSSVFRQNEHLFNFTRCGVADRYTDDVVIDGDDGELVSLANDGSISLKAFGRERANDLSKLIAYVIHRKWVDEWVPRAE